MALLGALGASARAQTPPAASATPSPPPAPSGAPPAPADAAAATPPAPGGGAGADPGAYTVRLRSLEKNVNELKEQIFRTKARLNLLKETVLGGVIGASRAIIHHKNEMGSSFKLIKAAYALDGVQIFAKADETGALAEMQDFDVYNGAIQPGSHTLSVALTYQGNGFGVFSYLKGYKFNVKSSHTFVAGDSKTTNITVVGYEKGNITTQLSDKPAVDFRVNVISAGEGGATAAAKK
ncbi:MAG TPA: dihydrolipoamide acetyltransferase [Polyangia bacterium]